MNGFWGLQTNKQRKTAQRFELFDLIIEIEITADTSKFWFEMAVATVRRNANYTTINSTIHSVRISIHLFSFLIASSRSMLRHHLFRKQLAQAHHHDVAEAVSWYLIIEFNLER